MNTTKSYDFKCLKRRWYLMAATNYGYQYLLYPSPKRRMQATKRLARRLGRRV